MKRVLTCFTKNQIVRNIETKQGKQRQTETKTKGDKRRPNGNTDKRTQYKRYTTVNTYSVMSPNVVQKVAFNIAEDESAGSGEKPDKSEKSEKSEKPDKIERGARDTKARKVSLTSILQRKKLAHQAEKDKPTPVAPPTPPKSKNVDSTEINILLDHANRLKSFEAERKKLSSLERDLILCNDSLDRLRIQQKIQRIQENVDQREHEELVGDLIERYKAVNIQDPNNKSLKSSKSREVTGGKSGISKFDNTEKKYLIEEYCRRLNISKAVDPKKLQIDVSKCDFCQGNTIISAGLLVCEDCGRYSLKGSHEIGHSYKDVSETTYKAEFTYKRKTRYKDIVMSFQGRQHKEIPEELLDLIKQEIAKTPDTEIADLTVEDIRYFLKKIKRPSAYDQSPAILCKINNIPPVTLSAETEQMLYKMFDMIQEPYETVRPLIAPKRKSFLNNFYVLHKSFELLSLPEYQKYFKLLKSKDKLQQHDDLWEAICAILGWKYYSSAKIW